MSSTQYDSRTADKFVVRLPDGLRASIEAAANASDRSMNSVFIQAVRQYLDSQNRQQILLDALANSVTTPVKGDIPGLKADSVITDRSPAEAFNIDTHIHMIVDARRYQSLRDRGRVSDINTDLCAVSDGTVYFGRDLDNNVDDAIRLARLEELPSCAD